MTGTIVHFARKYAFLSNFYPVSIMMDGVVYPSVEHAYQAAKTIDDLERDRICMAATPGEAKRLGKTIKLRRGWKTIRLPIMYNLLTQKFSSDPFKGWLTNTGDSIIIEGNSWHDKFWGKDDVTWEGENHLGRLLMVIRSTLNEWN